MSGLPSAIDELAAADVEAMVDSDRGAELRELYLARTRLDAQINRRISTFDGRALGDSDGAPSTQSWLRAQCRLAPSDAGAEVQTARGLRDLPIAKAAWEAGEVGRDHVRAITLLAKQTSVEATQSVEEQLVAVAREAEPLRFATELRKWRDAWRGRPENKDESSVQDRRELIFASSLDGMTAVK